MVAEIFGGISAFKSLFDIAKVVKEANDATVRDRAIVDLLDKIITAREAQSSALDRIRELEEEIARFETWGAEKDRYELKKIGETGVTVRSLKDGVEPPETPHYICADCYEDRIRSYLQAETRNPGRSQVLTCNRCGADLYTSGSRFEVAPENWTGG
jgi:hypothetical protein